MSWLQAGQQKIQQTLDERLPQIKKLFTEKIQYTLLAKVQDDESMRWASQKIYKVLPFPIHILS